METNRKPNITVLNNNTKYKYLYKQIIELLKI